MLIEKMTNKTLNYRSMFANDIYEIIEDPVCSSLKYGEPTFIKYDILRKK